MTNSVKSPNGRQAGKVAAITGGATGMGRATALAFAVDACRYAVTRGTFPLTSQIWEEGDVHEQGSTRDST